MGYDLKIPSKVGPGCLRVGLVVGDWIMKRMRRTDVDEIWKLTTGRGLGAFDRKEICGTQSIVLA